MTARDPLCTVCTRDIPRRINQAETLTIFFLLKYGIDGHKKITYTNFEIFLKISLSLIDEIVGLALRAVIDSFEIYTISSLIKKKSETNFIMSKVLLRVARSKQNKKYYHYYWRKYWVTEIIF